jgi:hypothetical protein
MTFVELCCACVQIDQDWLSPRTNRPEHRRGGGSIIKKRPFPNALLRPKLTVRQDPAKLGNVGGGPQGTAARDLQLARR